MRKFKIWGCLLGLAVAACGGDETNINDFDGYGANHPGEELPEGGEVRFDKVHILDGDILILQVQSFDITGSSLPLAPGGRCTDIRGLDFNPDGSGNGPGQGYTGRATYNDLGTTATFSNGSTDFVLDRFEDKTDFLGRHHDIMYGGVDVTAGVHDADLVEVGDTWSIDFDGADTIEPSNEVIFPAYPTNVNVDGLNLPVGAVTLTPDQAFELTWDPPTFENSQHTADRPFDFIVFKNSNNTPDYLCPLPATGEFTVPLDVIQDLDPAGGTIVFGRLTHMMGDFEGTRLDMLSIHCSAVPWSFE